MNPLSPYDLGATLYMPATRVDLIEWITQGKMAQLKSLVICLEDAIFERDLAQAQRNLLHTLAQLNAPAATRAHRPLLFVRPRDAAMAHWLAAQSEHACIDGLVLPKFHINQLQDWYQVLQSTRWHCMPTLETQEVFSAERMQGWAERINQHPLREHILALRIGGNDLFNILGLRRPRQATIYHSPLAYVLPMLASIFGAQGFSLTAPVCEIIDNPELLTAELQHDLAHGFVGKTAIHPKQIDCIHRAFAVSHEDYADAQRIIEAKHAVFASHGAMCEPATHHRWAVNIQARAASFGLCDAPAIDLLTC